MKRLGLMVVLLAVPALARPTLSNRDERRYDYALECASSTERGRVDARDTAPLSSRCKRTVKGAGSAKVHTDSRCVIKGGTLVCGGEPLRLVLDAVPLAEDLRHVLLVVEVR